MYEAERRSHDELVLHYQPKIDLTTRGTIGVEALLRWNHPRDEGFDVTMAVNLGALPDPGDPVVSRRSTS